MKTRGPGGKPQNWCSYNLEILIWVQSSVLFLATDEGGGTTELLSTLGELLAAMVLSEDMTLGPDVKYGDPIYDMR